MARTAVLLAAFARLLLPAELANLRGEPVSGAALFQGRVYTWGRRALVWTLDGSKPRALVRAGRFAEGGCVYDFNGDGLPDLVLTEAGPNPALVWFEAPRFRRRVIETGIEAHEVLGAELLGERGVLVIQRRLQVRYFTARGVKRDLYSFYTPSDQGGLALDDVDGDGRPDILAGNYWIQSPERFELPWRLFAINTWSEEKLSAMSAFALAGRSLVIAQADRKSARLARFEKPAGPAQPWPATRLDGQLDLDEPHSVIARGDEVYAAERAGAGRVIVFRNGASEVLASGVHARFAWADQNGLLLLTKGAIFRLSVPEAKSSR